MPLSTFPVPGQQRRSTSGSSYVPTAKPKPAVLQRSYIPTAKPKPAAKQPSYIPAAQPKPAAKQSSYIPTVKPAVGIEAYRAARQPAPRTLSELQADFRGTGANNLNVIRGYPNTTTAMPSADPGYVPTSQADDIAGSVRPSGLRSNYPASAYVPMGGGDGPVQANVVTPLESPGGRAYIARAMRRRALEAGATPEQLEQAIESLRGMGQPSKGEQAAERMEEAIAALRQNQNYVPVDRERMYLERAARSGATPMIRGNAAANLADSRWIPREPAEEGGGDLSNAMSALVGIPIPMAADELSTAERKALIGSILEQMRAEGIKGEAAREFLRKNGIPESVVQEVIGKPGWFGDTDSHTLGRDLGLVPGQKAPRRGTAAVERPLSDSFGMVGG